MLLSISDSTHFSSIFKDSQPTVINFQDFKSINSYLALTLSSALMLTTLGQVHSG